MIRQAPTSFKPSQLRNHPTNKRKAAKKTKSSYIFVRVFFLCVVLVIVIIPTKYLPLHYNAPTGDNHVDAQSSSILIQGLSKFHEMLWLTSKSDFTLPTASVESGIQDVLASKPMGTDGARRRKIAYAITITKDGFFQDGAAVLAYSIFKASKDGDDDISLVSFVHPSVITSRPVLVQLGYHVIEGEQTLEIKGKYIIIVDHRNNFFRGHSGQLSSMQYTKFRTISHRISLNRMRYNMMN